MALNDTLLRSLNAKAKNGETVGKHADGGGLNFEQGKYWRLSYRFAGKQKTLALGVYPAVSLKSARLARDKAKELLAQGIDPSEKKKADKAEALRAEQETALTFERVAREWFEKKTLNLSPSYRKDKLQRLENHAFPYIGRVPMSALDLPDLVHALEHLHGRADMCKRVAQIMSQVCRYARLMKYARYDVSSGLSETLPDRPPARPRAAIIDPVSIGKLLRDIETYQGEASTRYALKIMPYVFVRSGELRSARWDEIDLERGVWTIPAEKMKMRREHVVPLSRQVVDLFKRLKEWTGDGDFAFPPPQSRKDYLSAETLLSAVRKMGYSKQTMSIHGFRAIGSTLLNESGRYRVDVIEAQLAHEERSNSRRPYNRAAYLPERTAMMQEWADYLDALRDGCGLAMREWIDQEKAAGRIG